MPLTRMGWLIVSTSQVDQANESAALEGTLKSGRGAAGRDRQELALHRQPSRKISKDGPSGTKD